MKAISHTRYLLIEPLRGLAAVWVFLFHYQFSAEFQSALPLLHKLLKAGDRGVPMFFVISGYCLAAAAQRAVENNESCGRFLQRRAWRIFPTYWLSIVAIVATHWLIVWLTRARGGALDAFLDGRFHRYGWFDWVKIATLTQIFDQKFGLFFARYGFVNGAYWTLSIEFQFYLIVALSLFRARWFLPLTGLLSAISVVTYYHSSLAFPMRHSGLFLPFWSWFALGVAVFAVLERGWTPQRAFGRHARRAACAGVAAIGSIFAALVLRGIEVERLAFAAGFALLLWTAKAIDFQDGSSMRKAAVARRIAGRLLLGLGAMSYSLYLMHNQLSDCCRRLLLMTGWSSPILSDLVCLIVTLATCYGFYMVCEAPFLNSKRVSAARRAPSTLDQPSATAPFVPANPSMRKAA